MPWSTLQNWSGRFSVKIRRQQASASAGWPALQWSTALRKCSSASSGSSRRPSEHALRAAGRVSEHLVAAGELRSSSCHQKESKFQRRSRDSGNSVVNSVCWDSADGL